MSAQFEAKMLAHKQRVDAERREAAIARARQDTLRRITPGTATPASVMPRVKKAQ